jgi:nitroreductase
MMIFSDPDSFSAQIDCALAAQNMMLAAKSLRIGSCWIGLAIPLEKVRKIISQLGVLEGHRLMAALIFGYPTKEEQKAPVRVDGLILKWID